MELIEAHDIKRSLIIMIKNRPAKIINFHTTVDGKHGTAKYHIVAIDILNHKKYKHNYTSGDKIKVPHIKKYEGIILSIEDDDITVLIDTKMEYYINIIDDIKENVKKLFDIKSKLDEDCIVNIVNVLDEYWIIGYKR